MKQRFLCTLALILSTTFFTLQAQDWNEIISATASDANPFGSYGAGVDIDGDYAIVGKPNGEAGAAYILVRSGNTWIEQAKLTALDGVAGDQFGSSVAIDGDQVVIGAPGESTLGVASGAAYVFVRVGNNWVQESKLKTNSPRQFHQFGRNVAIDGNYAIFGIYSSDDTFANSGSAYIFERGLNGWTQQIKLTASDVGAQDFFGFSVSINGNYAVVSAPYNADLITNAGAAYIFYLSNNSWTEQAKLTATDAHENDLLGFSVAIDGDYAILGAKNDDDAVTNSGSAYIFERSGTNWIEQAELKASDPASGSEFGFVVAIESNRAIIGARLASGSTGAAYIFQRTVSTWTEQVKLIGSDSVGGDSFGSSVSIDNNYALVGALNNDAIATNAGAAYFFEKEILATTYTFNNGWLPSDPSGVAIAVDDIVIASGDAVIDTNTTCNSVTVNPGAGLTVNSGVTLTATVGLVLESSATSYSSLILDGTVAGNLSYERHVNINGSGSTGSNDLVSAPLTGQDFASFATSNPNILNNGALYLFGPFEKVTGTYVNWAATETTTLDAGVGFRSGTTDNGTVTFTGTAENGTITNDIQNAGSNNEEWNLVGNPYPSYMNVQQFFNHDVGGVTNIQLFDAATAAIYGYDGSALNGWKIYNLANTTASTVMAPGQGFFVSADATNAPLYDLEFTSAMRSTGSGDDFISGRNAELIYVKLKASTTTNSFTTDFYFNNNSSLGFDSGYDAKIWGDTTPGFVIYSHLAQDNIGDAIALQSLDMSNLSDVIIPLGVHANQGEQISFSIAESTLPASVNVYLEDTVANTTTVLNTGDYVITPTTNLSGTGRFFLRTSEDALSTIENGLDALNIFVLNSSKEIVISGMLQKNTIFSLYDIQGREILSSQLDSSVVENRIDVSSLSGGIYVVNLQNKKQQKSQKVIIK